MKIAIAKFTFILCVSLSLQKAAGAVTFPFTEYFTENTANWKDFPRQDLTHVAAGGPGDSAYVTTNFAFANATLEQVALFRAHNEYDANGDAFVGNWLTENVGRLTAYVRHNAPLPLDYFVRIARSANFPAVNFTLAESIPANQWTRLDFDISFDNPQRQNESGPAPPAQQLAFYNGVLSQVGNVQIGVIVPAALATDPIAYCYDLDLVSIVPEPASMAFALSAIATGLLWRRNRGVS